jgi:hypothetical protein
MSAKRDIRLIAMSIILNILILNICIAQINTGSMIDSQKGNSNPSVQSNDQGKKGVVYSGSGGRSFFISPTNPETPIEIKKFIDPYLKDGYLINNEIGVSVEVKNLKGEKIEGLSICERIDDNLNLGNGSNCYLTKNGNKSWMLMNKLKSGEPVNRDFYYDNITPRKDDNKTMTIDIGYLGPKSRAIYYYKLRPKEAGKFLLGTTVSFSDSKYQDVDYYMESECNNPIKVVATPERLHLYTGWFNRLGGGSSTLIYYKVKYQNISENSHSNRTIVEIFKSKYYSITNIMKNGLPIDFKDDKENNTIRFYLNDSEDDEIVLDVNYNKDNAYSIPALYIGKNPYPYDLQTITVEDFFNSRSNYVTFMILILLNILTLIATNRSQNKLQKKSLEAFENNLKMITDSLNEIKASQSKELRLLSENLSQLLNKIGKSK